MPQQNLHVVSLVWEKHHPNGKLPSDQKKGSFWWKENLKNLRKYRSLTKIQIKNGKNLSAMGGQLARWYC